MNANFKRVTAVTLKYLILFCIAFVVLAPLMWMLATSLRLPRDSWSLPPRILPTPPFVWQNYERVFTTFPFFTHLMNSIIVSSTSVVIQLVISSMAAYALSRIKFRGQTFVFIIILTGLMIPQQVTIIPTFIILREFRLIDSLVGLILPSMIFPLGVFLMRQFMLTIPMSYDEAAFMEGSGRYRIYWSIILPMVRSTIAVSSIMHLLLVWNDFFRPLVLINSLEKMTLPLGLTYLNGYMGAGSMSVVLAGIMVSVVPPILFFLVGQKYLMVGLETGGLKF